MKCICKQQIDNTTERGAEECLHSFSFKEKQYRGLVYAVVPICSK